MSCRRVGKLAWSLVVGLAVAATVAVLAGDGFAALPNAKKAAAVLVARLRAETKSDAAFGASDVVSRNGRLWLAVGSSPGGAPYMGGGAEPTRVRIYRWSGTGWQLAGSVAGNLGPAQWIKAVSLTGSRDPDFAIEGCGAGDTNCLSVVSDIGGRWHAVPFEYGYGQTLEVNGLPAGHLVYTQVDACSCAGGPTTITYERYQDGAFKPANPPGKDIPACSPSWLATVAYTWEVQVLQFDHVACADGWALAVGTGTGFTGPVVGLFDRGWKHKQWALLTLDNGNALPVAPAVYDLPLSLLLRLAARFGPALAPQVAAAKLIARLQSLYGFDWPQQNGIVNAGGAEWLVAATPTGRARNDYSSPPADAVIYHWNGGSWVVDGRVPHLLNHLNVDAWGGWFKAVPTRSSSSVAFELVGSCCTTTSSGVNTNAHSTALLTNEGGTWHVVANR
jgi:hypothetical protein